MITVTTQFPIAIHSDDHIHPCGVHLDNNLNPKFVEQAEALFNSQPINFLDLGCAGGELACEMHRRGHTSIGLEGSDRALNPTEDQGMPAGYHNWQQYYNTVLFTCDITKEYSILNDGALLEFDLITCMDVVEHFDNNELEVFMQLLCKHLKSDGILVASIGLHDSIKIGPDGQFTDINYHKLVKDSGWWIDRLSDYFTKIESPFTEYNRTNAEMVFVGKKK